MYIIDDYTVAGRLREALAEDELRRAIAEVPLPDVARLERVSVRGLDFSLRLAVGEPDEALIALDDYMMLVNDLPVVADCDGTFRDHRVVTEEERETAESFGAGMREWTEYHDEPAPPTAPLNRQQRRANERAARKAARR